MESAMAEPLLNIHAILPHSRVNGPGVRVVIFFQGCARDCEGCFNPDTHSFETRKLLSVKDIVNGLTGQAEGVTVSGGEPFMQAHGLKALLKAVKGSGLTTVVYTGFSYDELMARKEASECLEYVDVLIDGAFMEEEKEETLLARGSKNQKFHFLTPRYGIRDFYMPGRLEVTIGKDGTITETGFSKVIPKAGQ